MTGFFKSKEITSSVTESSNLCAGWLQLRSCTIFKCCLRCHFNNSVELCSFLGGNGTITKLGILHDGALQLSLECPFVIVFFIL